MNQIHLTLLYLLISSITIIGNQIENKLQNPNLVAEKSYCNEHYCKIAGLQGTYPKDLSVLIKNGQTNNEINTNIILYGPPGTGKTSLVELIAKEKNAVFKKLTSKDYYISDPFERFRIFTRTVDEAINEVRAKKNNTHAEAIIFIDGIDTFNGNNLDECYQQYEDIKQTVIMISDKLLQKDIAPEDKVRITLVCVVNRYYSLGQPLAERFNQIKINHQDLKGREEIITSLNEKLTLKLTDSEKLHVINNTSNFSNLNLVTLFSYLEFYSQANQPNMIDLINEKINTINKSINYGDSILWVNSYK